MWYSRHGSENPSSSSLEVPSARSRGENLFGSGGGLNNGSALPCTSSAEVEDGGLDEEEQVKCKLVPTDRQQPNTRQKVSHYGVGRYAFHRHPCLKMLRSLKKCLKHSPNPTTFENPTHQTTDIDAGRDEDTEGENRLRKISELMTRMGPILPGR